MRETKQVRTYEKKVLRLRMVIVGSSCDEERHVSTERMNAHEMSRIIDGSDRGCGAQFVIIRGRHWANSFAIDVDKTE